MNPETWDEDIAEIEPGGYLLYDSTRDLPQSKFRDDINVIGAPLTEICNRAYTEMRQRQLVKHVVDLGVLTALLDMDPSATETLIAEQFKGREALIKANLNALNLGRDWALAELDCPLTLKLRRTDKVGDSIFVNGNDPVIVPGRGVFGALLPLPSR
jgi:2-oxoglutarate ferredoxin oxidoreductase subunit alpha